MSDDSAQLTEAQRKRIAEAMSGVAFAKLLGIRLDSIEPGEATLSLQIRDDFRQNAGVVHGGVIASLIDSATAFAILPLLKPDERSTTVDLTISYLRPLIAGSMVAHAKVLRAGQRLIAVSAELRDDGGNLAATALSTYMRLAPKPKN